MMKRLYVGGLSHNISEKDIRDRFGKFGEVSDVEIKTRKDEDGSPFKTFGYVNINISDPDYKRCVAVLNKSRWKGGTLQIEPAKESFLHRLAEERQQAAEKIRAPRVDPQEKLVESFKVAGVENFHMKSAVPGTEVPGHKDWVVSKFGRVLPVLHLKGRGKSKVAKYDPSRHCHNIRRLDPDERLTSVSGLTWLIEGGDDEISKKRRGEFPPWERRPGHSKPLDIHEYLRSKRGGDDGDEGCNREEGRAARKPRVRVFNDDPDSEDEIRELVARERSRPSGPEEHAGGLEVVDHEFALKSGTFWAGDPGRSGRDEEYDSADTDEILTQSKRRAGGPENAREEEEGETPGHSPNDGVEHRGSKEKVFDSSEEEEEEGEGAEEDRFPSEPRPEGGAVRKLAVTSRPESEPGSTAGGGARGVGRGPRERSKRFKPDPRAPGDGPEEPPGSGGLQKSLRGTRVLEDPCDRDLTGIFRRSSGEPKKETSASPERRPTSGVDSAPESDSDTSEDSEYRGMMGNCRTLTLSLADLQDLVRNVDRGSSGDESEPGPSEPARSGRVPNAGKKPAIDPEDILASLLETDDESGEEGGDAGPSELPAFVGSRGLFGSDLKRGAERVHPDLAGASKRFKPDPGIPGNASAPEALPKSSMEPGEEAERPPRAVQEDAGSREGNVPEDWGESKPARCPPDPRRQQQDNRRRLAALEQRQKEAEQQKQLIRGALSRVDVPNVNKGKHVVFESDDDGPEAESDRGRSLLGGRGGGEDEDDGGVEHPSLREKDPRRAAASKLFDSADEEEEEEEDEGAEEERFRLKPQFEGVAGQKLMELQSRFGTDPRFQMDARFLDGDGRDEDGESVHEEGEQELVEEKKKNLAILQSLLNISVQPSDPAKASVKAKTFRDVSALHYDPTSEAHAAFETRTEESKKESKAARRKKREEAQKLPEVSKEIFYDVTTDLKEVFGTEKESQPEKGNTDASWDQQEENVNGAPSSDDDGVEPEEESGFKFSFFGNEATADVPKTDEYKAEVLKGAKVPWQVDPRLRDSSSDEEGDEEEEMMDRPAVATAPEALTQTRTFFFFFDGDVRLKEGPGMFCRSERLEDQRKAWEERRAGLREDCRKKHKDARRRCRMTMKP